MYYQDDWLTFEATAYFSSMSRVLFNSDRIWYGLGKPENILTDVVHGKITELFLKQKYCEAEDYLYDNFEAGSKVWLLVALDFYQKLNELSDEELEKGGFPRTEILPGIKGLVSRSGFDESLFEMSDG